MTQPTLTPEERQAWAKRAGQMNDEFPATPSEARAFLAYLDGQTTAHEAALRLFEVHDDDQELVPIAEKPHRISCLIQDAIHDFREQHGEVLALWDAISALLPDEFRLTSEEKTKCPDYIQWNALSFLDCHLDDERRLRDMESYRYNFDNYEAYDDDAHPLTIARIYVSLAEWYARVAARDGDVRTYIAPMKLALESDLLGKDWLTPHFRGQDPDHPYSAYDVEIPMVAAVLRHTAHSTFTPPGTYDEEETKSRWFYDPWDGKKFKAGRLWRGKPGWSFERWTFWTERLRWVIESKECPAKPETRESARAALDRMEEVERDYMEEKDKEAHSKALE